jgi:hypothetical protein
MTFDPDPKPENGDEDYPPHVETRDGGPRETK